MPAWTLTEGADNFPTGGPPPPDNWTNTGEDQINALGGDDTIDAGAMNDTVVGADGNDTIHGGDGGDIISGGNDMDTIFGDAGADSINGDTGADTIHGGSEIDTIDGGLDGDTIFGDAGDDVIQGGAGADTIDGGANNDLIHTGTGSDTAHGGLGNDTFGAVSDVSLAGDHDSLFGDGGDDILICKGVPGDGWTASFDGGANTDTVRAFGDIRHYTFSNVDVLENGFLIRSDVGRLNQFTLFTDTYANSDFTDIFLTSAGSVDFSTRLSAGMKLNLQCDVAGNTVIGGAGDDHFAAFQVFGGGSGMGALHLEGRGGNDTLDGGNGDNYLDGGAGADAMTGGTGNNIYIIDDGGDAVFAGGGYDEIRTSRTSFNGAAFAFSQFVEKVVFTGAGNFTGTGGNNDTIIVGGAGNDILNGGTDAFFSGNDTLNGGGAGSDTADYTTATSAVTVSLLIAGAQNTGASTGSDTLTAIDNLRGSAFSDRLTGDAAVNRLDGGTGNDVILGGAGGDILAGGGGTDTLSYAGSATGVTVSLFANTASGGDAASDMISGFERLIGSGADDKLTGSAAANVLAGGGGRDVLKGGLGNDVFDYNAIAESTVALAGRDMISDFNDAAADKIDLSTLDAIAGGANNSFIFIGSGPFSALGQVRAFASGANTIIDINTTGTNAADMRIFLTGLHTLDAADFVL